MATAEATIDPASDKQRSTPAWLKATKAKSRISAVRRATVIEETGTTLPSNLACTICTAKSVECTVKITATQLRCSRCTYFNLVCSLRSQRAKSNIVNHFEALKRSNSGGEEVENDVKPKGDAAGDQEPIIQGEGKDYDSNEDGETEGYPTGAQSSIDSLSQEDCARLEEAMWAESYKRHNEQMDEDERKDRYQGYESSAT